jgi:hypothetical protein
MRVFHLYLYLFGMKKKSVIVVTEQQFEEVILKSIANKPENFVNFLFKDLFKKSDEDKSEDKTDKEVGYSTSGDFQELDLNNPDDFKKYQQIADKFISTRSANLLGITGLMLANGAKAAYNNFGKYVPVELALAQLSQEGGFSSNPNARPIKTKNPFNVGNVDSGKNIFHNSVQSGIQAYYNLIAKNYLTGGKTASDLLRNFVNSSGYRYAGDRNYEASLTKIANQVSNLA